MTLWVAAEAGTEAVPYVFAGGELGDVVEAQPAAGETFTAGEGLAFDEGILDQVIDDLGDNVTQFSIVGGPGDIVRFSAIVESDRGGLLEVVLAPDGDVLESGSIDGAGPANTAP